VPNPALKVPMTHYVEWVKKLAEQHPGAKIHSCYEAGPCGYWLHRALIKLGVINQVVAPVCLNGRRKTDKRDARRLTEALDAFLRGNPEAFSVVPVPTEEQEQRRSLPRLRTALVKQRRRAVQSGASLLLLHGHHLGGTWCHKKVWPELPTMLPAWIVAQLSVWHQAIAFYDQQLEQLNEQIAALAQELNVQAPKGVGTLTWLTLLLEVIDWNRFKNRRQVGSYTGLCASEFTTGDSRKQGSIDRQGNRRVRHVLIEAVWRLLRYQPAYAPIRKLAAAVGRARRKLAVAAARRLAIDLWRLATGQTTAEKLKLVMAAN
jgi:transposase